MTNFGRNKQRFATIYEANPVGPSITREDFFKTSAALCGVLAMVRLSAMDLSAEETEAAYKQIGRMMSEEIGKQWSVLTALQYLTGQRADKALNHWREQFEAAGLTRARAEALVAVANDFCANGHRGKTLSSGLLVEAYKKRPMGPETLLDLMDLPEDVLARVRAQAD